MANETTAVTTDPQLQDFVDTDISVTPTEEQLASFQEQYAPTEETLGAFGDILTGAEELKTQKETAAETSATQQRTFLEEQLARTEERATERRKLFEEQTALSKEEQQAISTRRKEELQRAREQFEEEQAATIRAQEKANELGILRQETMLGLTGGFGSSAAVNNLERTRGDAQNIIADLESAKSRGSAEFSSQIAAVEEDLGFEFRKIDQDFQSTILDLEDQLLTQTDEIVNNILLTEDQRQQRINDAISDYQDVLNQLGLEKTRMFQEANTRAIEAANTAAQQEAQLKTELGLEAFRGAERAEERRIQQAQFTEQVRVQEEQFAQSLGLDREQFETQKEQFAQSIGMEKDQFDKEFGLREKQLLFDQDRFQQEFGQRQEEFKKQYDFDDKQLAETVRQYNETQKRLSDEFAKEFDLKKKGFNLDKLSAGLDRELKRLQVESEKELNPLRKRELEAQIDLMEKQASSVGSRAAGNMEEGASEVEIDAIANTIDNIDQLKDYPYNDEDKRKIIKRSYEISLEEQQQELQQQTQRQAVGKEKRQKLTKAFTRLPGIQQIGEGLKSAELTTGKILERLKIPQFFKNL